MMMTQGNSNSNDNAGGLSPKHLRFYDDTHDDNDFEDNIDELYANGFHNFEHIQNHDNEYAENIQGVNSF